MKVTRKQTGICPPTLHLCGQPLDPPVIGSNWSDLPPFLSTFEPESLFQIYVSLVRPHLEYASQVWITYKTGKIKTLENVQKFALIMCAVDDRGSVTVIFSAFSTPT